MELLSSEDKALALDILYDNELIPLQTALQHFVEELSD
jgi:hypothetical protein